MASLSSNRSSWPLMASETVPVSSEMTMTAASVSSERPMAARWRVRVWNGLFRRWAAGSGRRQAAATILSPLMMTAPSWRGEWGKKIETSRFLDRMASISAPRSA